jgi:hypothetical protein
LGEAIKEAVLKTNSNEWKTRVEGLEAIVELTKQNDLTVSKSSRSIDFADALSRLVTDPNSKIQIMSLEALNSSQPGLRRVVD